jgi:hypothetical protein
VVENPLWIASNQQNIVVNFRQEFTFSMHSNFFKEEMDKGIFYQPNHSRETQLHKKKIGGGRILLNRWVTNAVFVCGVRFWENIS